MSVKINQLAQQSNLMPFCYYWLPPLFLSAGILIMAGELGSVANFTLPVTILKFFLPSWSINEIHHIYFTLRKFGHFMAYAILFSAYVRAWRWYMGLSRLKAIILALAICLVISASDEWRQSFHESRTGCPQDVALDMSGALTAAITFFPFLGREKQRQ